MGQGESLHQSDQSPGRMAPYFRTPFTDILGPIGNNYASKKQCRQFELNFLACQEAYGNIQQATKCQDYFDDLLECTHQRKQIRRITQMQQERWRQYVKGLVGLGPEVDLYAEPPRIL